MHLSIWIAFPKRVRVSSINKNGAGDKIKKKPNKKAIMTLF